MTLSVSPSLHRHTATHAHPSVPLPVHAPSAPDAEYTPAEGTPGGAARRASLALLEAIIPGSPKGIPAGDEATLARTEAVVRAYSPALLPLWRGAQQAISAAAVLSTGRPFDALDAPTQEALLVQWRHNPALRGPLALIAMVYKFVHFDRAPVYAAMGGKLNVVTAREEPRWLQQVSAAASIPHGDSLACDVVVVGTGAGGAVVGRELALQGHAVLFAEEGEHYRRADFDGSSVRAHQRFYRGAVSVGNVLMPVLMGRLVGGSTAVNGGTCFRTPPWVLDRWCDTTRSDDFAPSSMAPWFERVERFLQVAPTERRYVGPVADVVARGCDTLGWHHAYIQRNAPGCVGSGFCDFGCRTDARRSTNLSYIPSALERGAQLVTGLTVDRVMVSNGRAVGVEGTAHNGRRVRVHARAVILAGGAIPTPALLLRQGLCNRSGQLGRNLSLHPSGGLAALFDDSIRGADHVPQGVVVDHFVREGFLMLAAQPDRNVAAGTMPLTGRALMDALDAVDHIAAVGTLISDEAPNGRVLAGPKGSTVVRYDLSPRDLSRMHLAMVRAGEMFLAAGAKRLFPVHLTVPSVEPGDFDRFRHYRSSPGELAMLSYHPLGTCAMGVDPKRSVVRPDHETHDVPGLYIVDGSTVPGPLGVNPQLTIMAMATRAAARIGDRLR